MSGRGLTLLHLPRQVRRAPLHLGLWALAVLHVGAAGAQPVPPSDEARQVWELGQQRFAARDYQGALSHFSRGHQLTRKGGFLFNMAECARLLGDVPRAVALYRQYLRDYPGGRHRDRARTTCQGMTSKGCAAHGAGSPGAASVPARPDLPAASPARPFLPAASPAPGSSDDRRRRPLYRHWGLWVGIGAVILAGSVTAAVLATRSDGPLPPRDYTLDFR